jgi:hypothetical protein
MEEYKHEVFPADCVDEFISGFVPSDYVHVLSLEIISALKMSEKYSDEMLAT